MKRAGKGSIWEYRIKGVKQAIGTHEEIANELNINILSLRTRCANLKSHEMILIKDSRPTYKMIINNIIISKGTVKEISDETNWSYSHLINVAKGQRKSKEFELIRVG